MASAACADPELKSGLGSRVSRNQAKLMKKNPATGWVF
jgi:hypothetical protein